MKERKSGWTPSFFTILVALWLVYFGYTFFNQQSHLDAVAQDRAVEMERLEAARVRNAALKEEKEGLDKPENIEKIAREELGMTKHGELPYIAVKR